MKVSSRFPKTVCIFLSSLFFFGVFSKTVLAASEDVEAVLEQLSVLQNNDIDAEWPPDIEANEALVETLLFDYTELSDEQKSELTRTQENELMAYFLTLYEIQGHSANDLDAFLAEDTPAASNSASVNHTEESLEEPVSSVVSTTEEDETFEASSDTVSQALPITASTSFSAEEANERPNAGSVPTTQDPFSFLQTPSPEGPYSFFTSATFGQILFFACVILLLFLLIRFFFSFVTLGPPPGSRRKKYLDRKSQHKAETDFQNEHLELVAALEAEDAPITQEATITVEGAFDGAEMKAIELFMESEPQKPNPSLISDEPVAQAKPESTTDSAAPAGLDTPIGGSKTLPKLGEARTGRPSRMPFSQGDAFDLDAIDE